MIVKWRPPRANCVKINTDAAYNRDSGKGSIGVVCRDELGRVLTMTATHIYATSPLMAEVLALRYGVQLGVNLQIQDAAFEVDNINLIETCRGNMSNGEIEGIVQDIKSLKQDFNRCGFTWVKREGNTVADQIAALAASGELRRNWTSLPPDTLRREIEKDSRR